MKNSDFIQMSQCNIFGVTFPTDNLVETLSNATFDTGSEYLQIEIVKNPMTQKKIHQLENGIFFSMRITYRQITSALLNAKVYELKKRPEFVGKIILEKEWKELAERELVETVPASSEIVNIFYSADKELLFTNKHSKYARTALHHLLKAFDLLGFRSIVVSDEKLGLHKRLENYLTENQPLFKFLDFQNEATLCNLADNGDKSFLTCCHLDTNKGRARGLEALKQGFKVGSLRMKAEAYMLVNFKLDSRLKIRSMRFSEAAETSRLLNGSKPHKSAIFCEYLENQFELLMQIARSTVLEFVADTKLESFI